MFLQNKHPSFISNYLRKNLIVEKLLYESKDSSIADVWSKSGLFFIQEWVFHDFSVKSYLFYSKSIWEVMKKL